MKSNSILFTTAFDMPTGKVVGFFIRPTTPTANSYQIEIVSQEPVSLFRLPEAIRWEPSVLRDFEAALKAR